MDLLTEIPLGHLFLATTLFLLSVSPVPNSFFFEREHDYPGKGDCIFWYPETSFAIILFVCNWSKEGVEREGHDPSDLLNVIHHILHHRTTFKCISLLKRASQVALTVKNLPANAGDLRDLGSIPGSGRSPGGGHGSSLQYSCLETPMDRGAWWAIIHRVTKNRTWLKWLSTHR